MKTDLIVHPLFAEASHFPNKKKLTPHVKGRGGIRIVTDGSAESNGLSL
ncbi:MAG TPA: hypothetical protein VNV88_11680 [Candidatus Solibacter sp.]|nr:hypothetical protein [Candidatus Solibacter sp.]